MFATWWQRLINGNLNSRPARSEGRAGARRRSRVQPRLESLEERLAPATHTWTGNGPNANWSEASNWTCFPVGCNPEPRAGELDLDLVFGPIANRRTNTNNINSLVVRRIEFTGGGYTLTGDPPGGFRFTGVFEVMLSSTSDGLPNNIDLVITLGPNPREVRVGGTSPLNLQGIISGDSGGGLQKTGPGELNLAGNNDYNGTTTLTAGTLVLGNNIDNSPLGRSSLSLYGGTIQVNVPFTLNSRVEFHGSATFAGPASFTFDRQATLHQNIMLTVNNPRVRFNEPIGETGAGNFGVTKTGPGELFLAAANTYKGSTIVRGGTLAVRENTGLGVGPNAMLVLDNGTTFDSRGRTGTLTLDNPVTLIGRMTINPLSDLKFNGAATLSSDIGLWVEPPGGPTGTEAVTFLKPIEQANPNASYGLIKRGPGKLVLAAANTYQRETSLVAGTLVVGHNNALGTGPLVLNEGTLENNDPSGSRRLANPVTINGDVTFAGPGSFIFSSPATLAASHTLMLNTSVAFEAAVGQGEPGSRLSIVARGPSTTLVLSAINTYSGGTTMTGGSLFLINQGDVGIGPLLLNGVIVQSGPQSGQKTLLNPVTLGGDVTFAGPGNLDFNGTITLPGYHLVTVTNNVSGAIAFHGNIAGPGVLIKGGPGALRIESPTNTSGGTIVLDGAISGTGAVGNITAIGGFVAPGTPVGVQGAGGRVALTPGATFSVDLTSAVLGTGYDQLDVAAGGTVSLGGAQLFLSVFGQFDDGAVLTILNNRGSNPVAGTFKDLPEGTLVPVGDRRLYISYVGGDGNDVVLTRLTTDQRFIHALYRGALDRVPSLFEMNGWAEVLGKSGRAAVIEGIERSPEARTRIVKGWYEQFIGRRARNFEEQGFVRALTDGFTEIQIVNGIVASDEYYGRAPAIIGQPGTPASPQAFVKALYVQILNRPLTQIGDTEVQGWVDALPALGRANVARGFLNSPEYRGKVVRSYYDRFLHRTPSEDEVRAWVVSGIDLQQIRTGFMASPEFYSNG